MILCTFQKGSEIVVIRISGHNLTFNGMVGKNPMFTTIDGLQLNPSTIVEEFPDLNGMEIPEMKREAIRRFKEHISKMETEIEIMEYLHSDLKKHDYKFIFYQRNGWRPVRVG